MSVYIKLTPKGKDKEYNYTIEANSEQKSSYNLISEDQSQKAIEVTITEGKAIFPVGVVKDFEEDEEIIEARLQELWLQFCAIQNQGIENTIEQDVRHKPNYKPEEIYVENKPFSIQQLINYINTKDLELSPDFQRHFVWDRTRQSSLIESIFLGLPLPSIYLSQYSDGILTVVDGLQRITTIKNFMEDKLRLTGLEYLENCNGKTFSELKQVLSQLQLRRFGQTQIMCFVIDYRSPSELKFDLFRRLNTGGKPLNGQEIRNCLARETLRDALRVMSQSEEFKKATDGSISATRMQDQELILRFMYFYRQYKSYIEGNNFSPIGNYDGNIEYTLNMFVSQIDNEENFNEEIIALKEAMSSAYHLFGKDAFRKNANTDKRLPINKLLFVSLSVLLAQVKYEQVMLIDSNEVKEQLSSLFDDPDFKKAISWSTNSKWNIEKALLDIREKVLNRLFQTED